MTGSRGFFKVAAISATMVLGASGCSVFGSQGEDGAEPSTSQASVKVSPVEASPTKTTKVKTNAQASQSPMDRCAENQVRSDLNWTEKISISDCDGEFLSVGVPQTDRVAYAQWEHGAWKYIDHDGITFTGFQCYDRNRMDSLGVSQAVKDRMLMCQDDVTPSTPGKVPKSQLGKNGGRYIEVAGLGEAHYPVSTPACDGRNILIVHSVIEYDRGDAINEIGQTLVMNRGSEFTYPGQCPSLRGQVDGNDVYPVYYDFGSDQAAMCAAKVNKGGNARTLNTAGDFSDPC